MVRSLCFFGCYDFPERILRQIKLTVSVCVEYFNILPLPAAQAPQTVHGGLILSLADTVGSLAVATKGQYMTGVSTDISGSFVRPAGRPGDVLKMIGTVTGMGALASCIPLQSLV
jgi:hypothetical protein